MSVVGTSSGLVGGNKPAGDDTEVQFNDNGKFGADEKLTYDQLTSTLTAENVTIDGVLTIDGKVIAPSAEIISQISHGFSVGNAVYNTGTTFALARANDTATANALGIVTEKTDDTFVLTFAGITNIFTGLTAGATYYLSPDAPAGGSTTSEPSISRPLYNAIKTDQAYIFTDTVLHDATVEGTLPYLVGKGDDGQTYKYNTIPAAVTAAELIGVPAVIIVMPGIYSENVTILKPDISLFAFTDTTELTEITGSFTSIISTASGECAIHGFKFTSQLALLATTGEDVNYIVSNCKFDSGSSTPIFFGGSGNNGTFLIRNCSLNTTSSIGIDGSAAFDLSAITIENTTINGDIDFNLLLSPTLTMNNVTVTGGKLLLTNSRIVSHLTNCSIEDTAEPTIDLTGITAASVTNVRNTKLSVTGGGKAVLPDPVITGTFNFSGITTPSGTVFDTGMGTPLASDGITFDSDSDGSQYLDNSGSYSEPDTIYTADGSTTGARLVTAPSQFTLSFEAIDSTSFSTADDVAFLILQEQFFFAGRNKLDGAGGITSRQQFFFDLNKMQIIDSTNSKGLEYELDYSTNNAANPRWLVDKGYVDGTFVTDNIYTSDGDVTSNREVSAPSGKTLRFTAFSAATEGSSTDIGFLSLTPTISEFAYADEGAPGSKVITLRASGMFITDSIDGKGLEYSSDYAVSNVSNPRWIVDKDYVDSVAVGSSTDAQVIFNDSEVLTGNSNFTFNTSTNILNLENGPLTVPLGNEGSPLDFPNSNAGVHTFGDDGGGAANIFIDRHSNSNNSPTLCLRRGRQNNSITATGDQIGSLNYQGIGYIDTSSTTGYVNSIFVRGEIVGSVGNGTSTKNLMPSDLVFFTIRDDIEGLVQSFRIGRNRQISITRGGATVNTESFPLDTAVFHAKGTSAALNQSNIYLDHQSNTSAASSQLYLRRRNDNSFITDGFDLGAINFQGWDSNDGDSVFRQCAQIKAEADGTYAPSDTPGRLIFSTTSPSTVGATERMRIDSEGLVDIDGALAVGYELVSASSDVGTKSIIGVDTTASVTVTFTDEAIAVVGNQFTVKDVTGNAGSQTITIATESAQEIDGSGANTTITGNFGFLNIFSDGTDLFLRGSA